MSPGKKRVSAFISYSHDSDEHRRWVRKLAERLNGDGVEVALDAWELTAGSDLLQFMEKSVTQSAKVLLVCTDNYNRRANEGVGGAGYEKNIVAAEMIANQQSTKFIPCIRGVTESEKTPTAMRSKSYIDFTKDELFESRYEELIYAIYDRTLHAKPPIGKNPFDIPETVTEVENLSSQINGIGPTEPSNHIVVSEQKLPQIPGGQSAASFFSERFANAFPGVRGIEWHDGAAAISRLSILFENPFYFSDSQPVWWWRDGDLQIESFRVLNNNRVLLGYLELNIKRIAAINIGEYYQKFIYVETDPSKPSGLYTSDEQEAVRDRSYSYEEYALFRGKPITIAEYEDGATVIDGEPVRLNGEAEIRTVYTSPYNLIIAPFDSPINNVSFDSSRRTLLNALLKGKAEVEDLANVIKKLPKRTF